MQRIGDIAKIALLAAFLGGGLLLVRSGGLPFWGWALLASMTFLMLYGHRFKPYSEKLVISDTGVSKIFGPKLRRKHVETVNWSDLVKVEVVTNNSGPYGEDMFFVLHGSGGQGVLVPGTLAHNHNFVEHLQGRLPDLNNAELIAAAGSVECRAFVVWHRETAGAANKT